MATTHAAAAQGSLRSGYPVGSPTRVCAATGRVLETGEPFVAALVLVPGVDGEEFRRMDLAMDAWNAGSRPIGETGRRLRVFGSWRGVMPEPGAKRRMLIDDESLLDLFEQSDGAVQDGGGVPGADDRRVFRFMLALILLRKKLLVCEKTGQDGVMFVRPRGSPKAAEGGVLSEVVDPGLSEDSVAGVVSQLSAVLDGEAAAPSSPVGGAVA